MGEDAHVILDDPMRAAIARLTPNEKECLRRRLLSQTAKEMALELGVSPHAVEKRLKMARAKLGVSSSLQAARMLVSTESQHSVPHASDLALRADKGDDRSSLGDGRRGLIGGMTIMTIMIAAALALALAPEGAQIPGRRDNPVQVRATPEQAAAFLASSFTTMDRDHSNYLEAGEAPPISVRIGGAHGTSRQIAVGQRGAMFLARNDHDGDGRVSREEFIAANRALIEAAGIPANWRPRR
jgi:DNA-binding CsgD family transcriptional regulator